VAMGYVLREFSDFFKGVLLIRRRTSFIGATTIFCALVSTGLYMILIPHWHMWGAAWATFLTFGTMAACMFLAGQMVYKVPWEYKRILIMGGLAIVILLTSRYVATSSLYLNMLIKGVYSLCFFPILYFFGFFDAQEKKNIAELISKFLLFLKLKKAST
jgi:O-antigen/teichoic acid export membrane protein